MTVWTSGGQSSADILFGKLRERAAHIGCDGVAPLALWRNMNADVAHGVGGFPAMQRPVGVQGHLTVRVRDELLHIERDGPCAGGRGIACCKHGAG